MPVSLTAPAPLRRAESAGTEPQLNIDAGRIDAEFARYDRADTPGCAVGVVVEGELEFSGYYGMAHLDYGIPLSTESRVMVGSVAKQFTAAAVLLLAQQGEINLEADIREYLPELPDLAARGAHERPVTVGSLIHHTSGVRDLIHLLHIEGRGLDPVTDDARIMRMLRNQQGLSFDPGARYAYSNTGYILLAKLVEDVSGRTLREFAAEYLFEPSGMESTHVHDDPGLIVPNRSMSYLPLDSDRGGARFGEFYRNHVTWIGARGLFTTLEDLARWERNHYDNRTPIDGFAENMRRIARSHAGGRINYAAGLFVGSYKGLETVGHDGNYMGFRSHYQRFPVHDTTIIVLCNSAHIDPTRHMRRVADIVFEEVFEQELSEFVGVYEEEAFGVRFEIVMEAGALYLERPRSSRVRLDWHGGSRFSLNRWSVSFEDDDDGASKRMLIRTESAGTRRFERVEPSE